MTTLQVPLLDVNAERSVARRGCVLVVDDDDVLRGILRDALVEAGLTVIEASDGLEALECVERMDCDLVLLDVNLPRLSGHEVLRQLRSGSRTRSLPVILLTADDELSQRVSGLGAGADDYVTKPFAFEEVVARILSTMRAHEVWREALHVQDQHRSGLARAMAGAARQEDLEGAAAVLCEAIADQRGVLGAAIVRFTAEDRAVTLAGAGQPPLLAEAILVEHVTTAPWIERRPLRVFVPLERFEDNRPSGALVVQLDGVLIDSDAGLAATIDSAAAVSAILLSRLMQRHRDELDGTELRALLAAGAFQSHFQPIVDLRSGEVVGAEALTRFADGSSPELRFDEASAVGLGIELELATLSTAVTAARSLMPADAWLSLNVTPELMLSPACDSVKEVLDLRDRDVVLELSERHLVTDYDAVRAAFRSTGEGIRWSIDDAGSGFASLRHILQLQPAFIKLDRSWVEAVDADPAKRAMIAGLCHFAEQTGAQLIAEGIESVSERDVLSELGVDLGQGYLLGRPAPVA